MMGKKNQSAVKGIDTLIGRGGSLEGKLQCDTNIRIDGSFSGEIECKGTVTVGEHGVVHSTILAEEIVIAGTVYGEVTAGKKLLLASGGTLHGSAAATAMIMMEGACLNGSVSAEGKPAEAGAGQDPAPAKRSKRSAAGKSAAAG